MKLPKLIGTKEIATVMGWTTQRARRWIRKTGAGQKRAGRVVTTAGQLVAHFPEAFQEALICDDDEE